MQRNRGKGCKGITIEVLIQIPLTPMVQVRSLIHRWGCNIWHCNWWPPQPLGLGSWALCESSVWMLQLTAVAIDSKLHSFWITVIHEHLSCLSSRVGWKAASKHPVCRNHAILLAMGVWVAVLPQCPTAYPSLTHAYLHLLLVTQPQRLGCFSKCVASRLQEVIIPPYAALRSLHGDAFSCLGSLVPDRCGHSRLSPGQGHQDGQGAGAQGVGEETEGARLIQL